MEITPRDLGQWRTVALIRLRATMAQMQTSGQFNGAEGKSIVQATARIAINGSETVPPLTTPKTQPMGFWTRFWAGGTRLEPEAARQVVRGMGGMIGGFAGGLGGGGVGLLAPGVMIALFSHAPIVGVVLASLGAAMAGLGFALPRYLLTEYARRPLTLVEIEMLADATDDPTEKAYLSVIGEAMRQPVVLGTQTERDVRAALGTLGEAIDKLPRVTAPHQNEGELRADAQKAWADADAEPDAIIAASLRRRAEAQEKTAQTAQKSALLVRRADALRREIEAQIEALRMDLSAFDANTSDAAQNVETTQNAAAHLSQLADSVQSVAREAGSLTDARDEVAQWTQQTGTSPSLPLTPSRTAEMPVVEDVVLVGRK